MAETTKIEWATHTWNPWIGCTKVHTGCKNCYAEAMQGRLGVEWGPNGTRRRTAESTWRKVEAWNRWDHKCMNCGYMCFHLGEHPGEVRSRCCNANAVPARPRVFPSLCDPFEDWSGVIRDHKGLTMHTPDGQRYLLMSDVRRDFFALIDRTPNLDWLLLTKRPENVRRMWPLFSGGVHRYSSVPNELLGPQVVSHQYQPNVWLLYSASDQATLESGLPHLLACRDFVPVLGLSLEPLVGPVELPTHFCRDDGPGCFAHGRLREWISWVVVGGESGPNARPCNIEWIRSIVQQCKSARVPCFVKQLGADCIDVEAALGRGNWPDGTEIWGLSGRIRLRDPKGGDPSEWPDDLRVQEFPQRQRELIP